VLDQRVDVRQILGTSDGPFVSDELFATEVEDRFAAEVPCNAVLPRFCEGHPVDHRQQVDPIRRHAELDDPSRLREILNTQPHGTKTKVVERLNQTGGIAECGFDKDVKVFGEARPPVKRQGMAADDDGANAPGVQAPKQFFEVARWLVH